MSPADAAETQHDDRRQQARAEAALWVARGSASDVAASPGLDAWLGSDPLRAEALGRTLGVWDELGQVLPDWKRDGPVVAPPAPARRRVMAMAGLACALLVCVLGLNHYWSPTIYRTGIGEQRALVLADGSHVTLNTGSELQVYRQGSERRSKLVSGEAMFDVAHDPEHPFIVEAAGRYVRALGTSFIVRSDAQRLDVTLLTGSVDIGSIADAATTRPVRLTPGERYRRSGTGAPSLDRPKLDMVTAWRNGELVLDETPLPEAVAEMNRYSSRPIVLQGAELARLRLSGVFQTSDSVSFATTVGAIYGVRVVDGPRDLRIVAKGAQPR
ncbi:FecR family protein [Sphingomonas gei]|uniref:FecR family protein n=1 Tax=Sphingomonas gei TaxID=1395960 RepID=UPI001441FF5D|nr:FecR domain-containing protein [Sphingomonas gei]